MIRAILARILWLIAPQQSIIDLGQIGDKALAHGVIKKSILFEPRSELALLCGEFIDFKRKVLLPARFVHSLDFFAYFLCQDRK